MNFDYQIEFIHLEVIKLLSITLKCEWRLQVDKVEMLNRYKTNIKLMEDKKQRKQFRGLLGFK